MMIANFAICFFGGLFVALGAAGAVIAVVAVKAALGMKPCPRRAERLEAAKMRRER